MTRGGTSVQRMSSATMASTRVRRRRTMSSAEIVRILPIGEAEMSAAPMHLLCEQVVDSGFGYLI